MRNRIILLAAAMGGAVLLGLNVAALADDDTPVQLPCSSTSDCGPVPTTLPGCDDCAPGPAPDPGTAPGGPIEPDPGVTPPDPEPDAPLPPDPQDGQ